ncbi:MAG: ion transporter [Cyanobacteria bacterium]|jgi:voltage-gated potassium channel|nr:ion transporter [Cyanobacteria bacterium GSL.Bin21]
MKTSRSPLKSRVYKFLDLAEPEDAVGKYVDLFLLGLIFLNLMAVALETVDWLFEQYFFWFRAFDIFSVTVFTVEYLLRVWSCTVKKPYRHPFWGRLRFMVTPLALIDLLAIIPFYLPLLSPQMRVGRALRLFRLFRVLKLNRYTDSLTILVRVLRLKQEELILSLFVLSILLAIASSLIYFAEHQAQPDAFSSIPEAMWWGTITLTTVGYGDVYPITLIGRMLGAMLAILGIGLFALPAGILASGFSEELQARKAQKKQQHTTICPHCGEIIRKE